MSDNKVIGILSRLDLEWLDVAAARVASGSSPDEVREALFDLLSPILSGGRKSGTACSKTVTVLTRVWSSVPPEVEGLRDFAVTLLPEVSEDERIALHWAMLSATYPFWAAVGATAGRLLSLQGTVSSAQLTRRMTESWGDRSTVKRSSRRIVRSMVRWGVLWDSETVGIYLAPEKKLVIGPTVSQVLLEALLLHEESGSVPVEQTRRHPALFPFEIDLTAGSLRNSDRFDVFRQGLDVDVVKLAG